MKYSENRHNYGNKVPDVTLQVHNICLKKKNWIIAMLISGYMGLSNPRYK